MQKIISGLSVKQLDADYINRKGISSHELMEQAALVFCEWYCCRFGVEKRLAVFCGTGNNGGDGLAISRLLWNKGYAVETYIMGDPAKASIDFKKNLDLLPKHLPVNQVEQPFVFSDEFEVIIDGVLGVGINRPLSGDFLELIKCLNALPGEKIAIDIPTGLPADEIAFGEAFKADYTLSFQFPKLSLLLPENAVYSGSMVVGDIGIEEVFFASFNSK